MKKILTLLFLTVLFLLGLFPARVILAQSPEGQDYLEQNPLSFEEGSSSSIDLNEDYWDSYSSDLQSVFSSPRNWKGKDWLKASLVTGTTLFLMSHDQEIQDYFQGQRSQFTDGAGGLLKNFGNPLVVIPALSIVYIYGKSADDERAREASLLSIESLIISSGLTYGCKLAGHRSRPYTGNSPNTWDGPGFSFDDFQDQTLSFPSHHSAVAFSVATVFSSVYDDKPWVSYLSYSMATLVALSRVNDNEHWSSDVFFGSILGYYTARTVMNNHSKKDESSALTIIPARTIDGFGLMVQYRF